MENKDPIHYAQEIVKVLDGCDETLRCSAMSIAQNLLTYKYMRSLEPEVPKLVEQ